MIRYSFQLSRNRYHIKLFCVVYPLQNIKRFNYTFQILNGTMMNVMVIGFTLLHINILLVLFMCIFCRSKRSDRQKYCPIFNFYQWRFWWQIGSRWYFVELKVYIYRKREIFKHLVMFLGGLKHLKIVFQVPQKLFLQSYINLKILNMKTFQIQAFTKQEIFFFY